MFPTKIKHNSKRAAAVRECPAHRKWVKLHACAACGTYRGIECAHVRTETDGGVGLKPSDRWCLSLCGPCHARQHQIGEQSFEHETGINMKVIAAEFFRRSPHRRRMEEANG